MYMIIVEHTAMHPSQQAPTAPLPLDVRDYGIESYERLANEHQIAVEIEGKEAL